MRYLIVGVALLMACSNVETSAETLSDDSTTTTTTTTATTEVVETADDPGYPPPPEVFSGPLSAEAEAAVDRLLTGVLNPDWDVDEVEGLVAAGDPRTAWVIADLLRFYQHGLEVQYLATAFVDLTGADWDPGAIEFVWATNHLLAWDLPAWEGYPEAKRRIFGSFDETWDRFFAEDHHIDWRLVTWGGVGPDKRPLDDNGPCPCIPALDHPDTTDASGGDWYHNGSVVFGLVVGDEALALPRHQMEVHEMVHVTLGGRELGIPYCTLCGSAQAYFVDDVPAVERVVLRTSGLLSRSNKLMYDLSTGSAIDTFTGRALSGPLADDGVALEQVSVVAATWGDWKEAHPDTRIVAQDGGIGRTYADDPLGGRDAAGPIFPVGEVDPRLPTQEKVVGVIKADGTPVAFPVAAARDRLADGPLEFEDLTVRLVDSIRVYDPSGTELVSHESFWFAWSQFHAGTLLWQPVD